MNKTQNLSQNPVIHYVTKPACLFGVAAITTVVCIFALRADNEHMVGLRNAVYKADKSNTNVTLALQNLQAYVTTHMNTNLSDGSGSVYPPIQLKYSYQRLLDNESSTAAASNSQLYTEAQSYCQSTIPTGFSGRYRVPCIEQYIENHDTSLPTIPDNLYKFDFVTPSWSPDLAGWSIVAAVLFWIVAIVITITKKILKR